MYVRVVTLGARPAYLRDAPPISTNLIKLKFSEVYITFSLFLSTERNIYLILFLNMVLNSFS